MSEWLDLFTFIHLCLEVLDRSQLSTIHSIHMSIPPRMPMHRNHLMSLHILEAGFILWEKVTIVSFENLMQTILILSLTLPQHTYEDR